MRTVCLILALACLTASSIAAAEPVKIFLFTNDVPSGSVDEQLKARQESLKDLREIFADPKYQGTFTLVPSRSAADVVVELLSRGEITTSTRSSSTRASGGAETSASSSSSVTKQHLKFRLSAGQLTHDLTTEGQARSWRIMAQRAADDIANWVKANDQQIRKGGRN